MVLDQIRRELRSEDIPTPQAEAGQLLVRVRYCGVCRTDLHICDGELTDGKLPLVLGHQVVGTVERVGDGVDGFTRGQRVGIPWLGWTCGHCRFCESGRENLCDDARFTGYHLDGGYAEYAVVDARFALRLPGSYSDAEIAPLLCAGLIGYRALAMTADAPCVGLYGFGSSAHIVAQLATFQGRKVLAFTRPGDEEAQRFARSLGAQWAGGSDEVPPEPIAAAIIFAPVGGLVPRALSAVEKGGTVVCAGIHMSAIPTFPYELLWGERRLVSVANLTRTDGEEFMALAARAAIRTAVTCYPLVDAWRALEDLRRGALCGAAVLSVD
ncbi:MAG: zinc-dependent alcohol dehydrogenase family protein [Polyangiaceae bacterium]